MVQILVRNIGSKETVCSNCNSHLRYMPSERKNITINHDYLGDYDTVKAIECPVCHCDTVVT